MKKLHKNPGDSTIVAILQKPVNIPWEISTSFPRVITIL